MNKFDHLEKVVEKKYTEKDRKRKPKMAVTGKSVFKLQQLILNSHDSLPKRKNSKENR